MTTLQARFQPTVSRRSDAAGKLRAAGDAILIERGRPRLLLLSCPCGCGEELAINLDPRAGPAWRFYTDPTRGFSLFPSVWRDTGCKSHFILWRNRIYVFGGFDDDFQDDDEDASSLAQAIQDVLPSRGLVPYPEIAETLDAIPWDVLFACRRLVRKGFAKEGQGKQRGKFGRA